jgi:hypothetical protein
MNARGWLREKVFVGNRPGKARRWQIAVALCVIVTVASLLLSPPLDRHQKAPLDLPWRIESTDGSVDEVLDRLDGRIDGTFGDHAAIVTETPLNDDGTLNEWLGVIDLYARSNRSSLWFRYLVGDTVHPDGLQRRAPVLPIPAGWPEPKIDDFLRQVKNLTPQEYYATDGKQAWPVSKGPKRDLAEEIWRGRRNLLIGAPRPVIMLIKDPGRPDLLGIYAEGCIWTGIGDQFQRVEQVCWLNSDRDDMPVETLLRDYAPDGKTVALKTTIEYMSHAQLPSGKWYPSRWIQTTTVRTGQGRREFRLQIFEGMRLEESWFVDPQGRATTNAAKR